MPARILQISSYPPPRAGWGVRVEHVRRRLESEGHTCDVLNMGRNRRVKSPDYVDVQGFADYVAKVRRFCREGYLVHAHYNGDSPKGLLLTVLAEAIAQASGKRAVVTFHAGPLQKYFPQERSGKMAPGYKLSFALAKAIVCNSEPVKTRIAGYGVPPDKITPIPAFSVQYLQFERTPLGDRIEQFLASRDPLLSSYVFFRPEFFIPAMIDAVKLLVARHPRLGLAIMGSDEGSAEVAAQIARLGLESNVLLCGDLPHDQFLSLMTRTRMYVRTPSKDGVCSSVLEALSLGLPVVASENGTRPASVVTFTPDNAADMAAKIEHVLANEDAVRRAVVKPIIRDTVADEVALLLAHA